MSKKNWEPGVATIVDSRMANSWLRTTSLGSGGHVPFRFIADVQPDSGAPAFRVQFTERIDIRVEAPEQGERVRVLFQPGNQTVKFDQSSPRFDPHVARDRRDALASAAPGSAEPGGEVPRTPSDSIAERKRILADYKAEPPREATPQSDLGISSRPAADPLERRLKELARLHEGGVLSDAEFAAAKARVIAET